ncbi:MAG: cysteine desulfurase [Alphaproteobacteria bacterium]|nr:cysteine desulfurase [Alphaproteobacteria bacterium]
MTFSHPSSSPWRHAFPALAQQPHGKRLAYLDSAASAQKPLDVIQAQSRAMEQEYANVHRGAHWLAAQATEHYEAARSRVQRFVNAPHRHEVIFTSNATAAINLVANTFPFKPGDRVLVTKQEHHSNIVPWFLLRARIPDIQIDFVDLNPDDHTIDLADFARKLERSPALVAIAHVSNVLGIVNPVQTMVADAHRAGASVLIDGSQAAPHLPIDVQQLQADFYVFTGHKLYGPTGLGVLWGKEAWLDRMPPFLGGGEMIASVSTEGATWAELPYKFEAGTPAIIQAQAMHAAIDFYQSCDPAAVHRHEHLLAAYAEQALADRFDNRFRLHGPSFAGTTPATRAPVLSFSLYGGVASPVHHPHDLATLLDHEGVAVRAGNHCAEVLIECLAVPGTTRASIGMYNDKEDIDQLVEALGRADKLLGA